MLFQQSKWKVRLEVWLFTLFYHSQVSLDYTMDVLVEPLISFMEFYTRFLGCFFVSGVLVMISIVVFTAHTIGFTFWWNRSPLITCFLCAIGYWILVNVTFNFFRAVTVSPGEPNNADKMKPLESSMCKRCISVRPARAHHCSVCQKCYLKMDHHCPWLNNCVGHGNHRYFFLTTVYIVAGCSFVILFGAEIAFRCFFGSRDVLKFEPVGRFEHSSAINDRSYISNTANLTDVNITDDLYRQTFKKSQPHQLAFSSLDATKLIFFSILGIPFATEDWDSAFATTETVFGLRFSRFLVKICVVITALICIGASILLGGLCWWHGSLISNGETSVEQLINAKRRLKFGDSFLNIYDAGIWNNWRIFLGLDQPGRSLWRHVLLPSIHPPSGDGYDWSFITSHRVKVEVSDVLDESVAAS